MKKEQSCEEDITTEVFGLPGIRKRKSLSPSQFIDDGGTGSAKKRLTDLPLTKKQIRNENSIANKKDSSIPCKKENCKKRWTIERYKRAEEKMLEVMKAEGAAFDNPISRTALRSAARKHIGDTGLLDHLLKHIDGKLAPSGNERFRRCYNTEGAMEYWLENAELVNIKREAGVPDSRWIPPPHLRGSSIDFQSSVCSGEMTFLKEEIAKIKSDMQLLVSQKSDKENFVLDLAEWRIAIDQRLMEISSCFSAEQDTYSEMVTWKLKIEKQLAEISRAVTSMQASNACTVTNQIPEEWDDFLDGADFNDFQQEHFPPWLVSTDLLNVRQDAPSQEVYSVSQPLSKLCGGSSHDLAYARELEMLKEEMVTVKRDVQYLIAKKLEEDQANTTPESSLTENSRMDNDHLFHMFRETFNGLTKWKVKMEQQVTEVSNAVSTLLASRK